MLRIIITLLLTSFLAVQTPDARIDAMRDSLVAQRRDFHMHPELSNREERTAKVIAEKLKALGLEVRTGVSNHGIVAVLKGAKLGPVVAIRADMDALPIDETINVPYKSRTRESSTPAVTTST
jgi:amidohydrolase